MAIRVLICRSNPIAPDPRVEKIAHALRSFGYQASLLGWDRSGELPENAVLQVREGEDGNLSEGEHSILIYRLPIVAPFGHGLDNLPNLLRWQWGMLGWLTRRRQDYDLIHACDFDTILPALYCKWRWGKKVVYDIFDFYADHLRATPFWLKRLIRFVDIRAIGWSDALILADDSRWEQVAGAQPKLSAVIYNSPSQTDVPPHLYSNGGGGEGLRLAYIGLLQVERGLMEMLDVLHRHSEWVLDLAGFGGDEDKIRAASESLPNVHWHGRIPYDQALELSRAADVLFATYDPAIPNHRYSSPNKVFEAMMLAKPIIVARSTNMDRIIEQEKCGVVVDYGDIADLEEALLRLQKDPALRQRLGENAFQAYRSTYSWEEMGNRLKTLYSQVTAGAEQ
jgi:glycosyltransferase involved in cell wall biosynthesis